MSKELPSDDKSDLIFSAEFASSQILRQLLEYLNPTISNIPIIFNRDEILIIGTNDSKTLFFNGLIETWNLMDYYINPRLKHDDDNPYKIYLNIESLLLSIKTLPKKGSFRIFQKVREPEYISLTVTDTNTVMSSVRLIPSDPPDIEFEERDPIPSSRPNKTILLSKFSHVASGASKSGGKSSNIRCYPRGVEIIGSTTDKGSLTHVSWGICNKEERICDIKVSSDIMKSMTKISNITTEAVVRIYCNNPYYIRLEIPIATLGTAYIYISKSHEKH